MADTTPNPEAAAGLEEPEVNDLDEARRIIASLRRRIAELEEMAPTANDLWIEVSDEDLQRLQILYEDDKLAYEQQSDPGMEVDEALMYFLSGAIDVAWDLAYWDADKTITPSA